MKKISYIYLIVLVLFSFSCGSTKSSKQTKQMKAIDINQMPKSASAPEIKFKKPNVFKLENGLTVIVVENHKLPRVNASLRIDNPPVRLRDKKGADDLLASMLGTGSKKVTKDEFNSKIDFYGARANIYESGFYLNTLSKYFPEVLKLTADQALNPLFSNEEFVKQQEKLIEGLKTDEKSTPAAAQRVLNKLAYGSHPYGENTTIETAKNVTLQDVENYYRRNYTPNHAYLIVVGDVTTKEVQKMTEQFFSNWKKAPQYKGLSIPRITNVPSTEVDFVNMPNAQQTELKVAHRSDIQMANPDYQKVLLMNSILGGDFNSYLNMTLREKHGWTYGARSRFGTDKYGALFTASTSVRNAVADSAVVVTMQQLNKIINEKVDPEVLENNKQKYLGSFVLKMEKPATIANQAYNIYVNNLPEDYYETFLKKIEAVTVDDIQAVAKKYLHPDKARIIVAGNAGVTVPGLEKSGFTIRYFDKYGNPARTPEINKEVPEGTDVKTIVDAYLKAINYKPSIQSLEKVYETKMQGMVLTNTTKSMVPNKTFNELSIAGNVLNKTVFDGSKGYRIVRGQKMDLTEDEINKMRQEKQPFSVLGLYANGLLKRMDRFDDNDYYVVVDKDGNEYYFNTKTGLLDKQVEHRKVQGRDMTQAIYMKDYKMINGIKLPGKVILMSGPQPIEFVLKDVKINSVNPDVFK